MSGRGGALLTRPLPVLTHGGGPPPAAGSFVTTSARARPTRVERMGADAGHRGPTTSHTKPPLIGRGAQLHDLVEALVAGRHVLLEGRAGVGKSRLGEDVVSSARLRHRAVDRLLACAGTTDVALAVMLPLIAGRSTRDGLGARIEWYLGRWRSRKTSNAPTLVWLDDVHHLDQVSAALIRQAVGSGDVQLFGTARSDEPLPDDVLSLLVDGTVERVHLSPLDRAASRRLATLCSRASLSPSRADHIARLAAGYPLFVRELALCHQASRLPPDGPGRAVLRGRLARISPASRRAAELVALAQPVPVALLAHRSRQLDTLERDGVLVRHGLDLVRLEHPLQAELLVHELGAARADCFRELAERSAATPGLVDPLLLIEWQLGAHQALDPAQAARGVRLALARTDVRAARRLLTHVTREHDLLLGQTLAVDGDLEGGVDLLERVRREAPDPELRVEAASFIARHLGLTRNDPLGAHEVLDRTEAVERDARARRHLLHGRLWLRLFGPNLGPQIAPASDLLAAMGQDDDQLAYDLAISGACVLSQIGVGQAAPLLERARGIERQIDVDSGSWCRARSVETWCQVYAGDLAPARRTLADAIERAWAQEWYEGFWLLVGNAALVSALAGRPRPDFLPHGWDHRTLRPAGPGDGDLYRLRALALAAWKACCVLGDPSGSCSCRQHELVGTGGAMPLLDVMVARAEALAAASRGEPPTASALPTALRQLARDDSRGWLALFYLDGCDLRSPSDLHRLVVERIGPAATGLPALAHQAAAARSEDDPTALEVAGSELACRGFLVPAVRVLADVTRMSPDPATRLRAVRGLAAADAHCQGAAMPWRGEVPGLPTPRQLEIVRAVTSGATTQAVADRWCLSRRTVENHVYRAARCLGATSREQLGEILADPCPGLTAADGDGTASATTTG